MRARGSRLPAGSSSSSTLGSWTSAGEAEALLHAARQAVDEASFL